MTVLCGGHGSDGLKCQVRIDPPAFICCPDHLPACCWFPGCQQPPAPIEPLQGFCSLHRPNGFNLCSVDPCANAPTTRDELCPAHRAQEDELVRTWEIEHFTKKFTPELRADFKAYWKEEGRRFRPDLKDRKQAWRMMRETLLEGIGYPKAGLMKAYLTPPCPTLLRRIYEEPFIQEEMRGGLTLEGQMFKTWINRGRESRP